MTLTFSLQNRLCDLIECLRIIYKVLSKYILLAWISKIVRYKVTQIQNERISKVTYHIQFHKAGGKQRTMVIQADVHTSPMGLRATSPGFIPNSSRNQPLRMACPYQHAWFFDFFFSSCCQENLLGLYPWLVLQGTNPLAFYTLLLPEIHPWTIATQFQMDRCNF